MAELSHNLISLVIGTDSRQILRDRVNQCIAPFQDLVLNKNMITNHRPILKCRNIVLSRSFSLIISSLAINFRILAQFNI